MGKLSPAEGTEGSAEPEEVKQSNFRFHIEVIILFALNMYVQDLGLGRRKVTSLRNTYECLSLTFKKFSRNRKEFKL